MTNISEEKHIWITGASTGLGRSLAHALAAQGHFVIISARNVAALKEVAQMYPEHIHIMPYDVGNSQCLDAVKEQLQAITPYLDIIICNAGVCEYEDHLSFDVALYEYVFNVNFHGVIRSINVALPLLKQCSGRSQIVAIGSLSSTVPFPRAQIYGSSKAALEYFMKSLRVDFSHLPIDLTLVRPGFISTELVDNNDFSMPFIMTPEQASQRVIRGVFKRKFLVDFPLRLSIPLRICGYFFGLWVRLAAPKITKIKNLESVNHPLS